MSAQQPTEPGRYLDAFGNTWRLWNDGLFRMLGHSDADPERYGPWRKLVVAEEPEWEYTYMRPDTGYEDDYAGLPANRAAAEQIAAAFPGKGELLRRVPAGPWMPAKQEGPDQ